MGTPEENEKLYQDLRDEIVSHVNENKQKFDQLFSAQSANTKAISELTASVEKVVEGTASIIQLHKDLQGATRVGKSVQNFMLWLLKWGAIGTGIAAVVHLIVEHFSK